MPSLLERRVSLSRHPSSAAGTVRSVEVVVRRTSGGRLALAYAVGCDMARVRIPPRRTAQRAGELWRHTCMEAFVRAAGERGYSELNLSPSGEWACYAFSDYRTGMAEETGQSSPIVVLRTSAAGFELEAEVEVDRIAHEQQARLALAAIIEEDQGLGYWALQHPQREPDFHHSGSFVLEI